jgi:hypothetical protein
MDDNEKALQEIIDKYSKTSNISQTEAASNSYILLALKAIQKGNHPILSEQDFSNNPVPIPNMTVYDRQTGKYTGVVFPMNTSAALDLHSINKKYNGRYFIPMDEIQRMKLDKYVKPQDQLFVCIQNRYTDKNMSHNNVFGNKSTIRLVNAESFLHPKGPLTEKEFRAYFPDFEKQGLNFDHFSKKMTKQLEKNTSDETQFKKIKLNKTIDVKNSHLPKLTEEMFHYEYCRETKTAYTPKFSKEEHLEDMINLFKKNPELLKEAIQQSGYIADKYTHRLFDENMLARTNKVIDNQQKDKFNRVITNGQSVSETTKVQKLVNHNLVHEHQKTRSLSQSHSRGM